MVYKLFPEICCFLWYQPSFREKLVFVRKRPLHFHQIPSQVIFPAYHVHAWILIDLLIRLHFRQKIGCYTEVMPR